MIDLRKEKQVVTKLSLTKPKGILCWLKLYRLYLSAFPASERKPFSVIANMHRKGKTDVWCMEKRGELLGFASTVNSENLILLDYLAVDEKHRAEGIGSQALLELKTIYRGKGVFVEIESTCEPASNREERQKRKQFYLNCGMVPLNVTAVVFGVKMELLGWDCRMDFDGYRAFYRDHYSPWAAEHIETEQ